MNARGLCHTHYAQARRRGDFGERCTVEGCEQFQHAGKMCGGHYRAHMKATGRFKRCKCDDCRGWASNKGYCNSHYKSVHMASGVDRCKIEGCELPASRSQYCSGHKTRKRKYGLTDEQFASLLVGLPCAICGDIPATDIDHDHATDRVRGFLCGPCNRGLGQFSDNQERLQMAITYLKHPPELAA